MSVAVSDRSIIQHVAMADRPRARVAIIGAGFAGCAAAVEVARAGYQVSLFEASATLGGRARTVMRDGIALDNGQHLLLGAYRETRRIAEVVQGDTDAEPWRTAPLAIHPFAGNGRGAELAVRELPAGFGVLVAIATAKGLTWGERFALVRWFALQRRRAFRCDPDATAAELLESVPPRARDDLLVPLCLAALNTPAERASAQLFLNVLREAFSGTADASSIVLPRVPLGEVIPERTATWLTERGHVVRRSARVVVATAERGVAIRHGEIEDAFNAAIVAVGPHQLEATLDERLARDADVASALRQVNRFEWEAIATTYLGYSERLRHAPGLLRLDGGPGQWLFDRSDIVDRSGDPTRRLRLAALIAVVISAHRPARDGHVALVSDVEAQLRRLSPRMPRSIWSQVIVEKRATYACTPGLERPRCGRLTSDLYLAGDYTYAGFPATLEAAVRSGVEAARALVRDRGPAIARSAEMSATLAS